MLESDMLPSPLDSSTSYLSTSTIVALCLFFALLCTCVIVGHLLEENRWANESITALFLVRTQLILYLFFTNNYVTFYFKIFLNWLIECRVCVLEWWCCW
ncbi:hypothetical protein RYX36_019597 [Vicia faba]